MVEGKDYIALINAKPKQRDTYLGTMLGQENAGMVSY